VIILLNGPFGVGKTTTARLLVERLAGARLYNPEQVGTLVRAAVRPFLPVPDYQELAAWRWLVPQGARLARVGARGPLVVPITVWRRDYLHQLTAALRHVDPELLRVQLTASEAVLRGRILGRPEAQGGHAWGLAHLASGLAMAADSAFGVPVPTDGLAPSEVVDVLMMLVRTRSRV
jgi:predicted kinase